MNAGLWIALWLLSLAVFFVAGFHLAVREVVADYEERLQRMRATRYREDA